MKLECMLTHLDLFSGVGGMSLALQSCSRTIGYCDIDERARRVLKANMQRGNLARAKVHEDVCTLAPPSCDLLSAGWPCIGFSCAGSRQGFGNEHSALFHQIIRVVRICRPRVIILENTPEVQREEEYIVSKFASLGFCMQSRVFTASCVGLPQKRARWYAIAYSDKLVLRELLKLRMPALTREPVRTSKNQSGQTDRFHLLKNTVVPRCATHAILCLVAEVLCVPQPSVRECKDQQLILKQGRLVIRRALWPTLHGHWRRGADCLTLRGSRDIQTAVRHEFR